VAKPGGLPAKGEALRVATFNLWGLFADWPERRKLLGEQLPRLEVDVCLLQEVVCDEAGGDQLHELAALLGAEYTARTIAESRAHETEHEGVAILSTLPIHETAVWPLPESQPPRHRLEASVESARGRLRVATLHAAVSADAGRDAQIAALAHPPSAPLVLGADLNAEPAVVRPLLQATFRDTLDWDDTPTWPVDADAFVQAWERKLGKPPDGDVLPRRLDYLLVHDLSVTASGAITLANEERSASDHRLVWADVVSDADATAGRTPRRAARA
jgi:endonuclease/exonuclease/phosphatase family metal-dependent hydrolase